MSHLFKKNKLTLKIIKLFFLTLVLILFFKSIINYEGDFLVYIIFSCISFYLIYFSFRKKAFFYESYFGVFLLLGFWFKFSYIISYNDGFFSEGISNQSKISPNNFDNALIASSIGMLGLIFFGHFREIFFNYPKKIKLNFNFKLYQKYRNIILLIFIFLILFVFFYNIEFQIYQRGLVGQGDNFLINGLIKTSLLYFLTFCSAIILYLDINSYNKIFLGIILLVIFEVFLSSLSMLSRGMIFNCLAIFYGLYKFSNKINLKLNLYFFIKLISISMIAFYISVISVNHFRLIITKGTDAVLDGNFKSFQYPEKKVSDDLKRVLNRTNHGFKHLIVFRWVGIDSMLIITKDKNKLSKDLFFESLKEKYAENSISFYEKNFNIYPEDRYKGVKKGKEKGNTLPGLITFLYFSGSYFLLFFLMMFFSFFAFIFEYLIFKSTKNNVIASSLIGMVIAYRFAHFGYLPAQSYLLFGSIAGIIIILFIINYLYLKIYK